MNKTPASSALQSVSFLKKEAERYSIPAFGPSLARLAQVSLPIPVKDERGLRVLFLVYRAEIVVPKQGLKIWPPRYLAVIHPASGSLERLRKVTPRDLGRDDPEQEPLPGHSLDGSERAQEDFITALTQLIQAYDALLPAFAAKTPANTLLDALATFRQQFPRVAEPPLLPYYQSIGRAFFQWLTVP